MSKTDSLAEMAVKAKEHGMTYGQYCTYLTTHKSTQERSKSPYRQIQQRISKAMGTCEGIK